MTRFLSRVLNDPRCGVLNEETQRLFSYHQATKHSYQSVRTGAHFLDWKNQPDPFRRYEGAPLIALPVNPGFPDDGTFATRGALAQAAREASGDRPTHGEQIHFDSTWLSRLLWHSMAISAWKNVPRSGSRYSLRVNPSSGNLHPTEAHLALSGFTGLDDGLYHYRADCHAIELRCPGSAWTRQLADALAIPWAAESPLVVGLTSIFWREAWKYRDRAYRYCCHDLGHAAMSLLLAACALGLSGGAIAHFADSRLTHTLGLAGGDEAPMAFLAFPPPTFSASSESLTASLEQSCAGIPNDLSVEEVPYELLLDIHCATILPDPPGLAPLANSANNALSGGEPLDTAIPGPEHDAPLGVMVRRRRSALDFDPGTPSMERRDVEQLLDFATRDWPADWRGNFCGATTPASPRIDFVNLYVYIHRVRGCEPGVHVWDRESRHLAQLHRGNVERVAAYLSLEQSLAGNACFAISMIADLAEAARIFGNRGYRYVHFEAGAIGQMLYVGAEALGWNATGMGAFYDDDVHRYLGFLPEDEGTASDSLDAAEKGAVVMLGSPARRPAAARGKNPTSDSTIFGTEHDSQSENRETQENQENSARRGDSSSLPRQVIYHFAVGRAIPDPRIEA